MDEAISEEEVGAPQAVEVEGDWPPLSRLVLPGLVAVLSGALIHRARLFDSEPLIDEGWYGRALDAAAAGEKAGLSVEGWYYPDITAALGSQLTSFVEPHTLFLGLRLANLAGCALVAALVGALLGRRVLALVIAAALMASPPIADAVSTGNVSGLLAGLIVLSLVARSPVLRSLWLVPGFLFKPYALALALSRPLREAALPLLVAGLLFFDSSGRRDLVNIDSMRNASPIRALHDLGIPLPWWCLSVAVLLVAALLLRGRDASALCAAWLSLPLAWAHTVVLVFPALAWAAADTLRRPPGERRSLRLVLLALAAVVLAQPTYFGLNEDAGLVGGMLGLLPGLAVVLIAVLAGGWGQPQLAAEASSKEMKA